MIDTQTLGELIERLWAHVEFEQTHPDQDEAADMRARTAEVIDRAEMEME